MRFPVLVRALLFGTVTLLVAGCGDDGGGASPDTTTTSATVTSDATTTTAGDVSNPTTTTDFVPPRPETTPNVSQPADSLLDGTHVVFVTEVDVADRTVVFDLVQWFYRDDFERAIADGRMSSDEPCIDLDFCIINADQRTRSMTITDDAGVSIVDWDHCCGSIRSDDLGDTLASLQGGHDVFVLTAKDGEIVAVDEVYLS